MQNEQDVDDFKLKDFFAVHLKKLELSFWVWKKKGEQINFLLREPVLFNIKWLKTEFHLNGQKRSIN